MTTTMMMIGNLLRVKDLLPTNGEDSSRARAYACAPHHLSIANTKKRPARDDARRQKKRRRLDRKERERERETKKERSPAAGDDPHWPTLYTWDWMFCGSQYAQIITSSKFNASSSSPLSRAQKSCDECQRFAAFVFSVVRPRTSTTRPPLMVVCPPRRGG